MAPSPGGGPGAFPRPGGGPRPAPGRASPEPGPTPGVPLPQRLAPPGDSAPESLEALIAKQSKLAQTLSENYRRAYVAGQAVSVEDTCLWQRRLAELRRDRKGKQGVPLSAIKEYWSQMVAVEESIRTQQRFGAGFIDMDQSEARFLRLQAEYWLRSAEAESTSDPAPRRTEERVSLARERRDLARTVYDARLREFREAGRGLDLEALCRWSCRWPDAQGDTIEFTAAKIAPLEEHLVRMNELKKLTEGLVREGKPAAAPIELTRAEFFCREAEYLLSRARNDPKAGLARDCRLLASEVYDHTRKALTRPVYGKKMTRPSELVYLWSRRWLETQRDMSDQKASQVIAYSEHLGRMEDLRALATKALMEGARDITQSDVDASEFYVCEAKAWLLESSPRGRGVAVEPGPEPTPVPRPPSR